MGKHLVDQADVLDPDRPFLVVDLAQALDDVAGGHIAGRQPVVLLGHRLFGGTARLFQASLDPGDGEAGVLRAVAQPVEELGGEGIVFGERLDLFQQFGRACRIIEANDLVGDLVCLAAHPARPVDTRRDTAKILDQHEADDRGKRPQLADLQGLVLLEAFDQRRHRLHRHGRMGVRDVEPGERHRPGNFAVADLHRRKLAIELLGEVPAHFLDRLLDDVVIVEQPFGRRRDRGAGLDVGRGRPVDPQDLPFVLAMTREEVEIHQARQIRRTIPGQRLGGLAQLINGEICSADRIVVIDLPGF